MHSVRCKTTEYHIDELNYALNDFLLAKRVNDSGKKNAQLDILMNCF